LTDVHGGEKFARFPISKDDLILGDRGYCNPAGIDFVRTAGGHVLVRLNSSSLPTYDRRSGSKIDVLGKVRGMAVGEVRSWSAWVKAPDGRWHKGRVVAVRRSREATLRELRKLRRSAKSHERHLGKRARTMAGYVLVWTSVSAEELSPRRVLLYYRCRWQLELVFKRAKSIMGLGQLPKKSDSSSRAWLSGKLLVAMMVEKLWELAESFSPWGYDLGPSPQSLA
jgi:IS4 transposase